MNPGLLRRDINSVEVFGSLTDCVLVLSVLK